MKRIGLKCMFPVATLSALLIWPRLSAELISDAFLSQSTQEVEPQSVVEHQPHVEQQPVDEQHLEQEPVQKQVESDAQQIQDVEVSEDDEQKQVEEESSTSEGSSKVVKSFIPTHQEVQPLVPKRSGKTGTLHTFKLASDGHIVAGIRFGDDEYLQVYSPDLELVKEIPISISATAISIDATGQYVIGGNGKLVRLSADGEVLCEAPAPHLAGESDEEVRQRLIAEHKKQMESIKASYSRQLEALNKQISRLEKRKEEKGDEFSKRDRMRLESLKEQVSQFQSTIEEHFSDELDEEMIKHLLQSRSRIPSVAVSGDDVFVAVSSGRGYEIWRTDPKFENGKMIIDGLSGCCGQFDFCAKDGELFLAENSKFKVFIYDRAGKRKRSFGKRGGDETGFGSCCNPMNVICTTSGDILTAESSIGKIKRFSQQGEMLDLIGKARIGAGCKHVALGFDEARNRYYIQYQDKNRICVLLTKEQADEVMADDRLLQAEAGRRARELDGRWKRVDDEKPKLQLTSRTPVAGAESAQSETGLAEDAEANGQNRERSPKKADHESAQPADPVDQASGVVSGEATDVSKESALDTANNDFLAEYLASRTNFRELNFDSQSQHLKGKLVIPRNRVGIAVVGSTTDEEDEASDVENPPARKKFTATQNVLYRAVPRGVKDGTLMFDLESSDGTLEFEMSVAVDGDSMSVTLVDDYSPAGITLSFVRSAD